MSYHAGVQVSMCASAAAEALRPCSVCGRPLALRIDRVRDYISGEDFTVSECAGCGLGVTVPAPARLEAYYGRAYYGNRHSITASYCARRRRRVVASLFGGHESGRLLDVGCGDGAFLAAARRAGWDVTGTEIAPAPRVEEVPVCATLEEAARRGPYRCITAWHVIEHAPDPAGMVNALGAMIEPDGALVLAVPDFGGWQARLFRGAWLHLDAPRHLFHFTRPVLARLLDGAGLRPLRWWYQELEYDWFGWIQSAQNAVLGRANILFDALTGKPRRAGRFQTAATLAGAAALALPALAMTGLGTLVRRGGTLIVAARPRAR
jgi:SAM-dependent methyltransferase